MTINNFTEMANFLNSNRLGIYSTKLNTCVNEYSVICACKPDLKKSKLLECDRIYSETIHLLLSNKPIVFNNVRESSLEFRLNGQIVAVLTR